ncbi:MAG: protoheme IX farnesyltransferase [Verrucomicrobia bacterium]|nr:protoheme IX farnesyltransferase [Verrucomicrobiota bacterium]
MKTSAQAIDSAQPVEKSFSAVLSDLFKARLTTLVLLTTAVGFYLGSRSPLDWVRMLNTVLGTGLLAAGAAALNQLIEREHDAKMRRTETRPLPSGRMTPQAALLIGAVVSATGMIYLALAVNLLTALLGIATLVSYLFLYTPLKRLTTLNTTIGAIPGALPPLMGWTAATGDVSAQGWALFAILFLWQLPHFYAIAWIYREDYARAGFAMLPVVDVQGRRTGAEAVAHSIGLLAVSLVPFALGLCGRVYLFTSLTMGVVFLALAVMFAVRLTVPAARRLFFASIIYLPLLLAVMVFDKVKG